MPSTHGCYIPSRIFIYPKGAVLKATEQSELLSELQYPYMPRAVESNKEDPIVHLHSSKEVTFSRFYFHKGVWALNSSM